MASTGDLLSPSIYFTPKNIIYDKDGFVIFKDDDGITAKGIIIDSAKAMIGKKIKLYGAWENSERYGKSFAFTGYDVVDLDLYYFLVGVVKGIGAKLAKKIISIHSVNLPSIIENNPAKLLEISGIKEKKLNDIVSSWKTFKYLKDLSEKYSKYGVTTNAIKKMYEEWGDSAITMLENDPYEMTKINGFGFKKADDIALKIGIDPHDKKRIEACIQYCVKKIMDDTGSSLISIDLVRSQFCEEIVVEKHELLPEFDAAIESLILLDTIVVTKENFVTTKKMYKMEEYIYNRFLSVMGEKKGQIVGDVSSWVRNNFPDFLLGDKQMDAVAIANTQPAILAIAGFAGAGKTSTSKVYLKLFEEKYGSENIVCCALSGVAANKAKIQSGFDGKTMHSLLGVTDSGFFYNSSNQFPYRVILLDEGSMVDTEMFYHFLKAIDFTKTTLIISGDPAQLPPVGPGNIFSDAMDSEIVPFVTLDKIYRQRDDQAIAIVANKIRAGEVPSISDQKADFRFLDKSIPDYWKKKKSLPEDVFAKEKELHYLNILDVIRRSAERIKPRVDAEMDLHSKLISFQVLSPIKTGVLGVNNLNKVLQDVLNPNVGQPCLGESEKCFFRENDKVIHLSNKKINTIATDDWDGYWKHGDDSVFKEQKVYNGQLGFISYIDTDDQIAYVYYPSEGYYAIYSSTELASGILGHAYALSIHKSQGSEFKNVVIPIVIPHSRMLNQKLLYTSITRGKEMVFMVGESYAFEKACKNQDRWERTTVIKHSIHKILKEESLSQSELFAQDFMRP